MDRKQIGRIGLSYAINYFTLQGYTVSVPLNDTQWYDLIVEKDGKFLSVQCKATATESGTIDFRNTGGTHGAIYGHALDTPVDLFFCTDKDYNCFVIPMSALKDAKVKNTITLRTQPNANHQGFQSYAFLIHLGA